jgi:hypothetical protein
MPLDGLEFLALTIPEFDSFVPTSRGYRLALGTETNAIDLKLMPFQSQLPDTLIPIPEFDSFVPTSRGYRLTIGAENYALNRTVMPSNCERMQ